MYLNRTDVETIVELLNKAFNTEGDVFGKLHNTACDILNLLESKLVESTTNQ